MRGSHWFEDDIRKGKEMNSPLQVEQMKADPRLAEAKRLLRGVLDEHTQHIQGIAPAAPDLVESYQEMLGRLASARGGATYFPYLSSGLGRGPFVQLADGSIKLDFIGGIGVHGLGHSHPKLLDACIDAALEDTVMQGNLQQHTLTLKMCERLLHLGNASGAKLGHCLISTSGAMANENALKIAFHAKFPANRILAIDNCFAGRSIAMAQLTDRPAYRAGIPNCLNVDHLPMFHPSKPRESIEDATRTLRKLLARYPGQYAAFWMELVAGEGGYYPGTEEYFRPLIQLCKEHQILIIFDEIQTFTRLSRPFAFQHFHLDDYADLVTIGKITQVCATLFREELKPKGPILSQTFTASSAAFATGLVILDELERTGCFGQDGWNMQRHRYFAEKLETLSVKYPGKISGPFGEGMMMAFTPGNGSGDDAKIMVQRLYDNGLMSFVAGSDPTRIRFLPPPGITTNEHIDLACGVIEKVLRESA